MSVSTSLPRRVSARGRARRWSRVRVALVVLLVLALVAGAGWVLLFSPVLSVRSVGVAGTERLAVAEVQEAAAVPGRTPLARLDTDVIAGRVSGLPVVRSVEVTRDWPDAVVITVRERTAVAVQAAGDQYQLVDREGVAFHDVRRRPRGLPLVSVATGQGTAARRAALEALATLSSGAREQVRSVRAYRPERITIRLSRGRTVVWGSTERSERKAAVLSALLTRKASVYDVSAPDAPTTRR